MSTEHEDSKQMKLGKPPKVQKEEESQVVKVSPRAREEAKDHNSKRMESPHGLLPLKMVNPIFPEIVWL